MFTVCTAEGFIFLVGVFICDMAIFKVLVVVDILTKLLIVIVFVVGAFLQIIIILGGALTFC